MKLQLETPRLLLRPFELKDAEELFELDKNPNVHKYLWQTPVTDINEIYKVIEMVQKQYKERGIGRFSTLLKETGELIGWTGIKFVNDHIENGNTNFYDYGYRLNEKFWGKGYASEATEAWIKYAFNTMEIKTLHAYTHFENQASNHILKKTGFNFMEEYTAEDGVQWNWWQLNQK
ncbi:GNAT family N-acetyltransferase [Flavobacterium sp.]|uniref:GNAT family N-acetyltransferase n=1 Tax=Flavobacterium sp. TaxID=239 RepID=UPI003D0C5BC3